MLYLTWHGQSRACYTRGATDLPIGRVKKSTALVQLYNPFQYSKSHYLSFMSVTRFEDLDLTKKYTFADYVTWRFSERVEIFRGWVARMSPAPSAYHQRVSTELSFHLRKHLGRDGCMLFSAPFDVRLLNSKGGESVVQPDLCVICDPSIIDEQACVGAPDFIIEILSPSNTKRELRDKFELYEESGVLEYWIVDPHRRSIERFVLEKGRFIGLAPRTEDDNAIEARALEGFTIDGSDIFP